MMYWSFCPLYATICALRAFGAIGIAPGKTTLARILAHEYSADFVELSAVTAKKQDITDVVERAKVNWNLKIRTVLFVDEIHRFNKAQQDAFLPHVFFDLFRDLFGFYCTF